MCFIVFHSLEQCGWNMLKYSDKICSLSVAEVGKLKAESCWVNMHNHSHVDYEPIQAGGASLAHDSVWRHNASLPTWTRRGQDLGVKICSWTFVNSARVKRCWRLDWFESGHCLVILSGGAAALFTCVDCWINFHRYCNIVAVGPSTEFTWQRKIAGRCEAFHLSEGLWHAEVHKLTRYVTHHSDIMR